MAERRRKVFVAPLGRAADVLEVGYRPQGEYWNEYLADDGSVIRLKLVVTEILRLENEWDAQGNPVYLVNSTNLMAVSAPDNLRRDPQ